MKPGTFKLKGINSETLNTYIQDRPMIDAPHRKVEFKSGYGVDGSVPFDEEAYENTNLEFIMVTNGKDLIKDRQALYNLLDTRGSYQELIPYFDPDKVYRVMLSEGVKFENKHYYGNAQSSSASFTVKPYKYLVNSPKASIAGKSLTINNPTNYASQPVIKLEGTGKVTLTVNGNKFVITDMTSNITINSELYSAYTEGATGPLKSMNDKITTREYPLLLPGRNTISIVGATTKLTVEPRWRSLV